MITTPTDPTLTDSMKQRFCDLVDDCASLTTGSERAQWLIDSHRLLNQFNAMFQSVLGDLDRNQDYKAVGALSIVACMAWKLHVNPYDAKRLPATARRLPDNPLAEEALQQGDITPDAAVRITQTMEQIGGNEAALSFADEPGELPPSPEAILVTSAREELPAGVPTKRSLRSFVMWGAVPHHGAPARLDAHPRSRHRTLRRPASLIA